jgi:hypothetical protein
MKGFKARQNYLLFIVILGVFLITGCGGGGEWTGHWLPGDQTAPTVISVVPVNNAVNVAITTKITATFSKDMDPLTISTATFTVQTFGPPLGPIIAGTVAYNATTRTATFTPTIPATLTASTKYQATITTGAKDLVRNALAANYVWVFTTGAAPDTIRPRVSSTIPLNGSVVAPTNAAITAIFTKNMAPATLNTPATSFTVMNTTTGIPVAGTVTYAVGSRTATFTPAAPLTAGDLYTATIKGTGASPATDTVIPGNALAGNQLPLPAASDYIWTFTPVAPDVTAPTVTLTAPADLAVAVALNSTVNATFSKDMDPLTISTATFTLQETGPPLGPILIGTVTYVPLTRIATFTPTIPLLANTNYTATVTNGAKDLAGNALVVPAVGGLPKPNPWTFTTGTGLAPGAVDLGLASTFGTFGGSAGMTNTGNLTLIDGDIGTISTANATITGFHEKTGNDPLLYDNYTDTLGPDSGAVAGEIYTCTNSTTGPNSAVNLAPATANAADCALATQARLDAQTAFIALAAMPSTGALAPNLAGLTITPGVYTNASSVLIEGGNLTLDAQGDANAVFVFQIGSTLRVGGPGVAFPQSVILAGGAQAKNVFWQVGTSAIINAAGGGTMEGTIIANSGVVFSTAANATVVTLNGRALSLISSVTMVNTVINVPLP